MSEDIILSEQTAKKFDDFREQHKGNIRAEMVIHVKRKDTGVVDSALFVSVNEPAGVEADMLVEIKRKGQ
jgi:hypothetical protein